MRHKTWQILGLVLVSAFALSSGGCLLVAGGAAASGAAGYAYYKGNVSETYDADFTSVWHASHDALYDLGMPVKSESKETAQGTIESITSKGDKVRIHVDLQPQKIPTDPAKTEVGVRVATFGDEEVSKRILAQIAKRTAPTQPVTTTPPNAEAAAPKKQTGEVHQASAEKKVP